MSSKLILASQSPFRKAQLEGLGFEFESIPPSIDERETEKSFTGSLEKLRE